jgi:hypothetical protein
MYVGQEQSPAAAAEVSRPRAISPRSIHGAPPIRIFVHPDQSRCALQLCDDCGGWIESGVARPPPKLVVHVFALVVAELLKVGDIELNRAGMSVLRRGQTIHIGPTDYRLLEFFMQAPGRVFSRGQLLDGVWGNDVYMDERTVDVHIGRLRKALVRSWSTDPIRTVRGAGYSFEAA